MPNQEQLSPNTEYVPRFADLQAIAIAETNKQLTADELLLELAEQKYKKGYGTMELMSQLHNQPPQIQDKLKNFIMIVALADLPDEDIEESLEDNPDKNTIIKSVNLVKEFKEKITH